MWSLFTRGAPGVHWGVHQVCIRCAELINFQKTFVLSHKPNVYYDSVGQHKVQYNKAIVKVCLLEVLNNLLRVELMTDLIIYLMREV